MRISWYRSHLISSKWGSKLTWNQSKVDILRMGLYEQGGVQNRICVFLEFCELRARILSPGTFFEPAELQIRHAQNVYFLDNCGYDVSGVKNRQYLCKDLIKNNWVNSTMNFKKNDMQVQHRDLMADQGCINYASAQCLCTLHVHDASAPCICNLQAICLQYKHEQAAHLFVADINSLSYICEPNASKCWWSLCNLNLHNFSLEFVTLSSKSIFWAWGQNLTI